MVEHKKSKVIVFLFLTVLSVLLITNIYAGTLQLLSVSDNSIVNTSTTSYLGYNYSAKAPLWSAYFQNNSNSLQTIRYEKGGYVFIFGNNQALTFVNSTNNNQILASINPVNNNVIINGNTLTYPNAWNNSVNVTYTIHKTKIKEDIILNNLSTNATTWDQFRYNTDIYFNNTLSICDRNGCFSLGTNDNPGGSISFEDANNNTILFLPSIQITDSANNTMNGRYRFKIVNYTNGMYDAQIQIRVTSDFIANATFPIDIDPTLDQGSQLVEYDDIDNPNLITDFILQKYNGTGYNIEPNTIWAFNETQCKALGKTGLCFGATDTSMNGTQLGNYSYIINSTYPIYVSTDQTTLYPSPIFSTSYLTSTSPINFATQYYNFADICNNINANCTWNINSSTGVAILYFISNGSIDPTVTVSASTIFSSSIFTNVTSEGNFSHLTIDTTTLPFNNLVAYLPFDIKENSSLLNRTYDYSQAINDGTLQNGTAFNSSGLFGSCYTFDGINDYINITLTTKVASSLWERNASSTTWTFLAYNGSSYYVNGVAITGNITYPINYTATGLRIGQNRTGGTYYNGSIDEVMIFNASLSGAQVLAIYNNQTNRFKSLGHQTIQEENITSGYNSLNLTISFNNSFGSNISGRVGAWDISQGYNNTDLNSSLNNLVSYYHLDEAYWVGGIAEVIDAMGRNNGTPLNSTSYPNTTANGYYYRAGLFDGRNDYINISITQGVTSIALWQQNVTSASWTFDVYNGTAFWTNGVTGLVGQFPVNVSSGGTNVKIGLNYTGNQFFNGTIDEVMIFNRSLTTAEIQNIYVQGRNNWNFTSYQNLTVGGNLFNISTATTNILPDFNFIAGNSSINLFYTPNLGSNLGLTLSTTYTNNPIVNIIFPTNTSYNANTINVSSLNYTFTDPNPTTCIFNNGTANVSGYVTAGTNFTNLLANQGGYNWTVFCNDSNGNIGSSSVSFYIIPANPQINFISQIPSDINTLNLYIAGLNISYNITDNIGVDASTVQIFYHTNSSTNNEISFINGTSIGGSYLNKSGTNNSINWTFKFDDNDVYPGTWNLNQSIFENTPHSAFVFGSPPGQAAKIQIQNVTNNTQYNIFEFMANTSSASPVNIYYCNSSYSTGNFLTNSNCILISTLLASSTYNITNSLLNSSSYQQVPLVINTSTGKVAGSSVVVTPISYFILYKSAVGASTWKMWYIATSSRTGVSQTTTNTGGAWTSQTYTFDAHLHQYTNNETFYYYVCGNNTANPIQSNCSSLRSDLLQEGSMPPSSPIITNPTNGYYAGNITINYTAAVSPNNYPIVNYNISLVNLDETFNTSIRNNNSINLGYSWNSSVVPDGNYLIEVIATDNNSLSSYDFSENFTIDNTNPNATLLSPSNATYTKNLTINFTYNVNDSGSGLANSTLYVYNSTGLFNQTTTLFSNTLSSTVGITIGMIDGVYNWFVKVFDNVGNSFTTKNNTLIIDNINPFVNITYPVNGTLYGINVSSISYIATDNNKGNVCWYTTNGGVTNSTPVLFGDTFVNVVSVEGTNTNTWTVYCNDSAGNQNSSTTIFSKDTTPPTITVIEPVGETENFNETLTFAVNVSDTNNVSYVSANVTLPDSTVQTVNMMGGQMLSDNFSNNKQWFLENSSVEPSQVCTHSITGGNASISLSGDGTPGTDTVCTLIGNKSIFGDFDTTIYYNLSNLTVDSAINFELTSDIPSSVNAYVFAYIGRTNFAGEGDGYAVFGQDGQGQSGFLATPSTTDTYGAMRIRRVGQTFYFYVLNNTNNSWILLANNTYVGFDPALFIMIESESVYPSWGNATAAWSNFSMSPLPSNQYIGQFSNTSLAGTYNVKFFANNSFNNINNYTLASFKINQSNYPPSPPYILTPSPNSIVNRNFTITWAKVIDANNDVVVFNISLLNPNGSFNKTIVSNYGNLSSTSYIWDSSFVPDSNYSMSITVSETLTPERFNITSTILGNFTVINTPPNWTNVPANTTINYLQSLNAFYFNVTSPYNISSITSNDTRFTVTSSGIGTQNASTILTNATSLAAGNYTVRLRANDTLNNIAYVYYQVNVNQIAPTLSLNFSPSSSVQYGTSVTVTGDTCPSQLTCNLYKNNSLVSNPYTFLVPYGIYNFTYNTTGNQNYTPYTNSSLLTAYDTIAPIINQTHPLNGTYTLNTTLNFTVNMSDNGSGLNNITYYVFNSTNTPSVHVNNCYQEDPTNLSQYNSSCTQYLLNTGGYDDWSGSTAWWGGCSAICPLTDKSQCLHDGNWSTCVGINPAFASGSIAWNYTKPIGAVNNGSYWTVADDTQNPPTTNGTKYNLQIPADCWNAFPDKLRFQVIVRDLGSNSNTWSCWNGTTFNTLRTGQRIVYEDAMTWNISIDPTYTLVNQTSVSLGGVASTLLGLPITLVDGVYNWFVNVFDITGNSATSQNQTFIIHTTAPSYSNVNINASPIYNTTILYSTTWNDGSLGGQLKSYVFSVNYGSGWNNHTYNLTGSTNISTYSELINTNSGSLIQWYFTAYDLNGLSNSTPVQNYTVQPQATNIIFNTDKIIYEQGYAALSSPQFFVNYTVRYTDSINNPIPTASCYYQDNLTNTPVLLTYNPTTGNYTGQQSTRDLYGVVNVSVNCLSTNYISQNASQLIYVYYILFLQDAAKANFDDVINQTTYLSRLPPTGPIEANITFNGDYPQGLTFLTNFDYCGSGTKCALARQYLAGGTFLVSNNFSISNNTCQPVQCLYIRDNTFAKIYEDCNSNQSYSLIDNVPTWIVSNWTDQLTFNVGFYIGTSIYLNCSQDTTNVTSIVYYNATGSLPNILITNNQPLNTVTTVPVRGQYDSGYILYPNASVNAYRYAVQQFNNTNNITVQYQYTFFPSLLYPNSLIPGTTNINFTTNGTLWASDNVSRGAPQVATVNYDNAISFLTPPIANNSLLNLTSATIISAALRDRETLNVENTTTIQWTVNVTDIYTTNLNSTNVSVITNFSAYGVNLLNNYTIAATVTNSSGTYNISFTNDSSLIYFPNLPIFAHNIVYEVIVTNYIAPVNLNITINPNYVSSGQLITVTGTGCPTAIGSPTCNLYEDGTLVSNPFTFTSANTNHLFIYNTTGNLNYYNATVNQTFYIYSRMNLIYTPTLETYLNSTANTIKSFCYDTNNSLCNSDVNCSLTAWYPNSSLLISQSPMTWNMNYFSYSLSAAQTALTGNYNGLVICNNLNQSRNSGFTYVISTTGSNINDDVNNISFNVWNYTNRTLTSNISVTIPNVTVTVNNSAIADAVWTDANRTLTYYADTTNYTLIPLNVWNYNGVVSNNLLTQFAYSVWNYVGSITVVSSQIGQEIWSYPARYTHGEVLD